MPEQQCEAAWSEEGPTYAVQVATDAALTDPQRPWRPERTTPAAP
ncbi:MULTISPECIES: hypothetical protein [unclassified Micromonospora]